MKAKIIIAIAIIIILLLIFKADQMKLNNAGKDMIKDFEDFRSNPYLDGGGVATIGYGFTYYPNGTKVTLNDKPLSVVEANIMFNDVVNKYENAVNNAVSSKINRNQFSALVSFAYNVGIGAFKDSTLLRMVNSNPKNIGIRNQFMRWIYDNGNFVPGLRNRREKEANLYFKNTII